MHLYKATYILFSNSYYLIVCISFNDKHIYRRDSKETIYVRVQLFYPKTNKGEIVQPSYIVLSILVAFIFIVCRIACFGGGGGIRLNIGYLNNWVKSSATPGSFLRSADAYCVFSKQIYIIMLLKRNELTKMKYSYSTVVELSVYKGFWIELNTHFSIHIHIEQNWLDQPDNLLLQFIYIFKLRFTICFFMNRDLSVHLRNLNFNF